MHRCLFSQQQNFPKTHVSSMERIKKHLIQLIVLGDQHAVRLCDFYPAYEIVHHSFFFFTRKITCVSHKAEQSTVSLL